MPRRSTTGPAEQKHPQPARVAVVDDRGALRRGFSELLRELGYSAVLSVERGEDLLAALRSGLEVEVALVHVELAGLGGQATLALLEQKHPAVRVLALCDRVDDTVTLRAYRAKVKGILRVKDAEEELGNALADAVAGRIHLNAVLERLITGSTPLLRAGEEEVCVELTPRELETIQWRLRYPGATERFIAERMGVDVCTVHEFMKRIYAKWGVHNSSEAVVYALKSGLYPG